MRQNNHYSHVKYNEDPEQHPDQPVAVDHPAGDHQREHNELEAQIEQIQLVAPRPVK